MADLHRGTAPAMTSVAGGGGGGCQVGRGWWVWVPGGYGYQGVSVLYLCPADTVLYLGLAGTVLYLAWPY